MTPFPDCYSFETKKPFAGSIFIEIANGSLKILAKNQFMR